uniref:Uncharacterized protein n=1 Tax=Solanum tuberosum TaxID=4113 RepID=M0ZYF8_SOLTU
MVTYYNLSVVPLQKYYHFQLVVQFCASRNVNRTSLGPFYIYGPLNYNPIAEFN